MPSVGMRRSTRVFGARTLRSGRRLWTEPQEGNKNTRLSNKENESDEIVVNFADRTTTDAGHFCKDLRQNNQNYAAMDIKLETVEEMVPEAAVEVKSMDQMCGIVYQRKRKREELTDTGLSEDKRFGKKFVRKRSKRNRRDSEPLEICGDVKGSVVSRSHELAIVVYKFSDDSSYWITCFLNSVLSYMRKVRLGIRRLSAFLLSKPIFDAYHSHGILFHQGSITSKNPGVCVISGSRSLIPLFHVDFSAIPFFLRHMHTNLWFRSLFSSCSILQQPFVAIEKDEEVVDLVDDDTKEPFQIAYSENHSDILEVASPNSPEGDRITSRMVASPNDKGRREVSRSVTGLHTVPLTMQLRSSHKKIQKRRSSLRQKRGRKAQSSNVREALVADFLRIRRESCQSSAAARRTLKDLDKSSSIIKELKSNVGEVKQDICASSCTADLLITETDKCYREVGAIISLNQSDSKKWSIVIMKDGMERCNLTPEKIMKISSFNRFTHATQWASDVGWKLEFPDKQDWLTFRELYKECFDRNSQGAPVAAAAASVIPVPGVHEVVSCPADNSYLSFVRPDSYITMRYDELTRALDKKTANYDMDSDDEDWLKRFNDEMSVNNEFPEHITPERFELIIDSLEKSIQYADNEYSDGQAADDICIHTGMKEAVEPIRRYWIKKRKQKHLGLLKIFQLYQPRRTPMVPRNVSRKKRSFKHPANQRGRGKQRTFLRAISFERDAMEQRKNHLHKVQEAKAVADRSEELAVEKRQRAQLLTENADLATYKAVIALRIAEAAAQFSESADTVASFFLAN